MVSNESFKAAVAADGGHPLTEVPGWHLGLQRTDFMHAFFLGLALYTTADLVWDLALNGHWDPVRLSLGMRIRSAYSSLRAWCRRAGYSLSHGGFTLGSLNSPEKGNYPCFSCKAHDCRMLISWLAEEVPKSPDIDMPTGQRRVGLAYLQFELCRALEEAGDYLSASEVERISVVPEQWLEVYTCCALEAEEAEQPRWHLVPKVHTFIHLFDDVILERLNPSSFAGWVDEDFMNYCRQMAAGLPRATMPMNTLQGWWGFVVQRWDNLWPVSS